MARLVTFVTHIGLVQSISIPRFVRFGSKKSDRSALPHICRLKCTACLVGRTQITSHNHQASMSGHSVAEKQLRPLQAELEFIASFPPDKSPLPTVLLALLQFSHICHLWQIHIVQRPCTLVWPLFFVIYIMNIFC